MRLCISKLNEAKSSSSIKPVAELVLFWACLFAEAPVFKR
jgi:hypothetical protein